MIFTIEFEYTIGKQWPVLEFKDKIISVQEQVIDDCAKMVTYLIQVDQKSLQFSNVNKSDNDTIVNSEGKIVKDQIVKLKKIWCDNILLDLTRFIATSCTRLSSCTCHHCRNQRYLDVLPPVSISNIALHASGRCTSASL